MRTLKTKLQFICTGVVGGQEVNDQKYVTTDKIVKKVNGYKATYLIE